jgi:cyclophilin family peptidyl-prolyl cis-trans isomerase
MTVSPSKTYTATIVTSCGTMVASLDVKDSPNTVNDFVYLAGKGFYNGLTFHRIVKDFAIQGGDPMGTGSGGPGFEVTDTVPSGFQYAKGVLAMANAGTTGGAGSQFFIVPADSAASRFQPLYAVLGHVTSGLDVIDKLNATKTGPNGQGTEQSAPVQPVYIEKVTVTSS